MSITRKEIQERKSALLRDLRMAHHHGVAMPGEMALSQRELSARYGLSMRTISIELQKLVDEGVLYTVPRVGTFVGRPKSSRDQLYLALFRYLKEPNVQWAAIRAGFEERIASLGGTSLVLDFETARRYREVGEIVSPSGIFEFHDHKSAPIWQEPGIAHVEFGELGTINPGSDAVYFDNVDGGWKATRHLLALGHKKIAFVALHGKNDDPGFYLWSREREQGWRRALNEAGLSAEGLVFQPENTPAMIFELLDSIASDTAKPLLKRDDVTAIVTVNGNVTKGLFHVLRGAERKVNRWPAVVGFDTLFDQPADDAMNAVTALRLPWEELGREAANMLWERSHGRLEEPQQRLVPMTLIPRLSCRQEWHRAPNHHELVPQRSAVAI